MSAGARARNLARNPSLADLAQAPRHLAHDAFLCQGHYRPLTLSDPDHRPLARIEGVEQPFPAFVVVTRPADIPASRYVAPSASQMDLRSGVIGARIRMASLRKQACMRGQ